MSEHWDELRGRLIHVARNRCQACNKPGPGLHGHHRTYTSKGTEEECFDVIILCGHCHALFHSGRGLTSNDRLEQDKQVEWFVEEQMRAIVAGIRFFSSGNASWVPGMKAKARLLEEVSKLAAKEERLAPCRATGLSPEQPEKAGRSMEKAIEGIKRTAEEIDIQLPR